MALANEPRTTSRRLAVGAHAELRAGHARETTGFETLEVYRWRSAVCMVCAPRNQES